MAFTDCPGPQSESAGKSDACEGCPNQQICATAPKGPDPGTLHFYFMFFIFLSNNHPLLIITGFVYINLFNHHVFRLWNLGPVLSIVDCVK